MESSNIPGRIKLARKMAQLATQATLLKKIPQWKPSRLGNYEAGISTPGPDDILLIAQATGVSPCWLMFGLGPIRPNERDLQAIRHQNLLRIVQSLSKDTESIAELVRKLRISRKRLNEHMENPFLPIDDALARRLENYVQTDKGWMDEQHVENDPLCMSFPEDMREWMMIYSQLTPAHRAVLMATVRTLKDSLGG